MRRCLYITAANTQCLLASGHDGAHDPIGDQYSQPGANDPNWGRKRAEVWRKIEQSEIVGNLYRRCTSPHCGHTAGGHLPGGRCVAAPGTCSCMGFLAVVQEGDADA